MILGAHLATDDNVNRKARGAFFTPAGVASFIANWAIRTPSDRILEPSSGDAEFLVHAVARLKRMGIESPHVSGVELHEWSAAVGRERVRAAGGVPGITSGDFFDIEATQDYDVVIGNPPYIRFQEFSGESRSKARAAALRAGVSLSGLASSWAAFTIHSALCLRNGGRLGFVLPGELLHSTYAAPVRRFLFENFSAVDLILFEDRVFEEADVEAVLLLADGYGGSTRAASVHQIRNVSDLRDALPQATAWSPLDPSEKWSSLTLGREASSIYAGALNDQNFETLGNWGKTRLGLVTGNNRFFTMTPSQAIERGLGAEDLMSLSPPGSRHLRSLCYSRRKHEAQSKADGVTLLFRPVGDPSPAAAKYIAQGKASGVSAGYKCRVRKEWWRVPLVERADAFVTYMNETTPSIASNEARVVHLNSVHGLYFKPETRSLGKSLLPVAALNSLTMLGAEFTGRAFGGGMLKLEPGEAAKLAVPSVQTVKQARPSLLAVRSSVEALLNNGELLAAASVVDEVLLVDVMGMSSSKVAAIREARSLMYARRKQRNRRASTE